MRDGVREGVEGQKESKTETCMEGRRDPSLSPSSLCPDQTEFLGLAE